MPWDQQVDLISSDESASSDSEMGDVSNLFDVKNPINELTIPKDIMSEGIFSLSYCILAPWICDLFFDFL